MKLSAYGKTDVGLVRSNNEDSFFLDEQLDLFIVADGMGGHAAGEIASKMAIETICRQLEVQLDQHTSAENLLPLLADTVEAANQAISQAGEDHSAWSGMGTTLTMLLVHTEQALLTHVGDSRLYRWRRQQLEQISEDQTLVADQIRRGVINETEARQSNLRNILLQAVGTSEKLDIFQLSLPIQAGDRFLLCSDGLTGMLTDKQICAILNSNERPDQAIEKLISAALTAGGKDNVTAVLVTAAHK